MLQKEIARRLKVSPAVVSMVLRGKGRVSPEKRTQILELARLNEVGLRKLSKRVDAVDAAGIRKLAYCGLQERIGWFHVGTFSGLNEPLLGIAYEMSLLLMEVTNSDEYAQAARKLAKSIPNMALDGLIVGPHDQVAQAIAGCSLPTVHLGYFVHIEQQDLIAPDNFSGAFRLVQGLLARGRRRIALVRCNTDMANSMEKYAGIQAALASAGLSLDPALVVTGDCHYQEGARCASRLCEASGPPPDAIILENDWLAPDLIQHLRGHLPGHWPRLSELDLAMYCDADRDLRLTTPCDRILLPRADMGRLAIRRLLEHIAHPREWHPLVLRVAPIYQPGER